MSGTSGSDDHALERRSDPAAGAGTVPLRWAQRTCLDADEHAESLSDWDQRYEQLSPGRFAGQLTDAWFGSAQVFRERTNQVVIQAGQSWPGACTLGLVFDAEGEGTFCDRRLEARSALVFGQPGEFSLRTPRRFDVAGIAVSADALQRYCDISGDHALGAMVASPPAVLPDSRAIDALRSFVSAFFETLAYDASPFEQMEAQRGFVTSLLCAMGAVMDGGAAPCPVPAGTRGRVVQLARQYLSDHRDAPVTVADLCREVGVSRRTLQYCFQDVLGVSPVQYLRAMRLNGVRRELKRSAPGARVGDIAARWGFWHLSQFSADYRRMFGELPSETSRSGR